MDALTNASIFFFFSFCPQTPGAARYFVSAAAPGCSGAVRITNAAHPLKHNASRQKPPAQTSAGNEWTIVERSHFTPKIKITITLCVYVNNAIYFFVTLQRQLDFKTSLSQKPGRLVLTDCGSRGFDSICGGGSSGKEAIFMSGPEYDFFSCLNNWRSIISQQKRLHFNCRRSIKLQAIRSQ